VASCKERSEETEIETGRLWLEHRRSFKAQPFLKRKIIHYWSLWPWRAATPTKRNRDGDPKEKGHGSRGWERPKCWRLGGWEKKAPAPCKENTLRAEVALRPQPGATAEAATKMPYQRHCNLENEHTQQRAVLPPTENPLREQVAPPVSLQGRVTSSASATNILSGGVYSAVSENWQHKDKNHAGNDNGKICTVTGEPPGKVRHCAGQQQHSRGWESYSFEPGKHMARAGSPTDAVGDFHITETRGVLACKH
jgi:hypothetical protein